ncbi:hypothetical protein Ga0074812_106232 [Parafrankia irregularis]|uniref:Uncharacterized protein n=1 Tax=Parafrankia irregularis TaxID=795642 RepID=A0A0S4QL64_9ACTN|nr:MULTISPECIES: hypothetical protein [Parafrankia]MBE3202188.1 hypothetical protein [Parafrankia sp. CH37]CUU55977.1 hypothetical protein Ga0074812_106232 [Parafrankia irregularis]
MTDRVTDQVGLAWSAAVEIGNAPNAAWESDPAGSAGQAMGARWPIAAWASSAVWSARPASGSGSEPDGQPASGGPEGGPDERTDRNAGSSSAVPGTAPGTPVSGPAEPLHAGGAAAEPTGPAAASPAGAPGTVAPRRATAVPPRPTPAGPPGSAPAGRPGAATGSGSQRLLDTDTEHQLLLAQIRELDRRIARMDVLIRLLEADVERNHLTLATLGRQQSPRTLPPRPPETHTGRPGTSGSPRLAGQEGRLR